MALEFGIHGFKPYRCAQIFARGFGDCKDKATLIVTMLGALGIKATPVVVRTANKGEIETMPASLAPFDHMIAYVPSLDLYLDGTAEYTGSLELPAMDRGALALQVNEGKREAGAPSRTAGERERDQSSGRRHALGRRRGAGRVARRGQRRRGGRMARPLPRRVDAQAARPADDLAPRCRAAR